MECRKNDALNLQRCRRRCRRQTVSNQPTRRTNALGIVVEHDGPRSTSFEVSDNCSSAEQSFAAVPVALSLANLVGGVFFLLAATSGFIGTASPTAAVWLVDIPYFLGSAAFMVGSFLALWMWKSEHYGLGLLTEINVTRDVSEGEHGSSSAEVLSMHAQYGCGRSNVWQLPWLFLYIVNASASVLDISLCLVKWFRDPEPPNAPPNDATSFHPLLFHELTVSALNFALSHGILLLGSVVHHVPTAQPHKGLLLYMRAVLFVYTVNNWVGVAEAVRERGTAKG